MSVPGYETFMLPLLRLAAQGEVRIRDCVTQIAHELGLSEVDLNEMLPSGRQTRFANRVNWAKSYLVQAGLLEKTGRGKFKATERGLQVHREAPSHIDNSYLARFPEFEEFRARHKTGAISEPAIVPPELAATATPEEVIDEAFAEITDELRANLLESILSAPPAFFEKVIIDLLLSMGYGGSHADAGRRVGGTGDGGIDGVINEDALGLDVVYLQAKRYATHNAITPDQLRSFSGSLLQRGASKGVFVTTSRFTEQAKEFARSIPQQRIVLIDGDNLTSLLVQHGVGVETVRTLEIKRINQDYFDADAED